VNVIIERALVIPRSYLEDYGLHGVCIHKSTRVLYAMGLKDYITVTKGYYAKIEVFTANGNLIDAKMDESSSLMLQYAANLSASYPDQLGLVACMVNGVKTVFLV
jgi:hypothetical protein